MGAGLYSRSPRCVFLRFSSLFISLLAELTSSSTQNSGFILGLPPRYLFRLRDFLEILEPDEVDALEDALDALDDRDQHSSSNEVGPYTFTLSGQGIPGSGNGSEAQAISPFAWSCHSAIHRPCRSTNLKRVILELELIEDMFNPLSTESHEPFAADERVGQGRTADNGEGAMNPSEEELMESTASIVRPLRTLSKISKKRQRKGRKPKTTLGEYDAFSLIDSIDDQMSKAENLATFLKVRFLLFSIPLLSSAPSVSSLLLTLLLTSSFP